MHHDEPLWIRHAPELFLTVCCSPRGPNQLCLEPAASTVMGAVQFYIDNGTWWTEKFLLMPDHFHAVVCVAPNRDVSRVIGAFKRFTARRAGIRWQCNHFVQPLGSQQTRVLKWGHVLDNPVRAGLVATADEWPYRFEGRPVRSVTVC